MGCSLSSLADEPSAASCAETTQSDVDRHNCWTGSSNPVSLWPISAQGMEGKEHIKAPKPRDPTNGWGYVMARPHDPEKRRRGEVVKGGRTIGERLEAQEAARRKKREERGKKDEAQPAAEPAAASETNTAANAAGEGHDRASAEAEAGTAAEEPAANGGTVDASSTVAHAGSEAAPNEPSPEPVSAPAPAPAADPAPVAAPAPVPIPAVTPEVAAGIAALGDLLAANPDLLAALSAANAAPPPAAAAAAPAPELAGQNQDRHVVNDDDDEDGSAIDWAEQPPRRAERYPRREIQRLRVIEQQREEERYWRERRDRRVHWDPPEEAGAE